jgi:phosphoribosylaminoimidazole (AIR) synthetase
MSRRTTAEELLKPHPSYLGALEGLLGSGAIKGLAHITGGGLLENIRAFCRKGPRRTSQRARGQYYRS